ncbi:MAG: undecaprenyl-diphosphate phosphatase [Acidobacteria bacterium]|nr:undecaprenyl-diphosphate phosphatase [Acidobacteriota bacterium]
MRRFALLAGGAALAAVALLVVAAARGGSALDVPTAAVLGLVEGITEYLPISSTGHLTVVERLFDIRGTAADAYVVVIQAGAILAVLVLYRDRVMSMVRGLLGADPVGRRLAVALLVAFIPAAVIGVALGDTIKHHLFGVGPVAVAWAIGGVVILVASPRLRRHGTALESLTPRTAFIIGVAQALALWPGVSRSLVTILAGLAVGLALPAAVEFSFLLGLLTLGAATAFDGLKHGGDIVSSYGILAPAIGFVVAFAAAVIAVRWMVAYLERGSLTVFGYYRLLAAAIAVVLLVTNVV